MNTKLYTSLAIFLLFFSNSFAQQEKGIVGQDNWLSYWTDFRNKPAEIPEPTKILSGQLTGGTYTLVKREVYILTGDVYVSDSTTLVIEPGTRILAQHESQASLIITAGSKIEANGTQTDPILFTSDRDVPKAGDWGGIIIMGDAPINKISDKNRLSLGLKGSQPGNLIYGGANKESNSGSMEYVRIEYAGKRTKDFGFFNALSLYAVGNQTKISNVMMSYTKGHSLYVAGGDLSLEQLVSYKASRTDFKFDYGTQVDFSNSLAVRSPYDSASKAFASLHVTSHSNKQEVDLTKSQTAIAASNLTLLNSSDNLKNAIEVGLVHEAIFVDANSSLNIDRSVISGFNPAAIFSRDIVLNDKNLQRIKFTRVYFNSCVGNIFTEGSTNNADLENYYGSNSFQNYYATGTDDETFIETKDKRDPDFRLRINKIIASTRQ